MNDKKHVGDAKIVEIAFSKTENRIGSVNSDYSISFWDIDDQLMFEKTKKTPERDIFHD